MMVSQIIGCISSLIVLVNPSERHHLHTLYVCHCAQSGAFAKSQSYDLMPLCAIVVSRGVEAQEVALNTSYRIWNGGASKTARAALSYTI